MTPLFTTIELPSLCPTLLTRSASWKKLKKILGVSRQWRGKSTKNTCEMRGITCGDTARLFDFCAQAWTASFCSSHSVSRTWPGRDGLTTTRYVLMVRSAFCKNYCLKLTVTQYWSKQLQYYPLVINCPWRAGKERLKSSCRRPCTEYLISKFCSPHWLPPDRSGGGIGCRVSWSPQGSPPIGRESVRGTWLGRQDRGAATLL